MKKLNKMKIKQIKNLKWILKKMKEKESIIQCKLMLLLHKNKLKSIEENNKDLKIQWEIWRWMISMIQLIEKIILYINENIYSLMSFLMS